MNLQEVLRALLVSMEFTLSTVVAGNHNSIFKVTVANLSVIVFAFVAGDGKFLERVHYTLT